MTKISPRKLDALPVEVLQRIASLGPCESTFALLRVNKAIYYACNDRQVFRAIVRNCNGHLGPDWTTVPLSNDSPMSSWARYALADSKARQWAAKSPTDVVSLGLRWAPQLMASSHPLVDSASALQLAIVYETVKNDDSDNALALALCLALRLMSKHPAEDLTPPPRELPGPMQVWETRTQLTRHLYRPLIRCTDFDIIYQCGLPQQRHRSRALVGAGLLAVLMRETFHTGIVRHGWGGFGRISPANPTAFVVPSVQSTVFHSIVEMPLPFTIPTVGQLGTSHLVETTSPDYLMDGEWTGIYTMSFSRSSRVTFDPPMRDIRFKASRDMAQLSVLEFDASGKDAVGLFRLQGRMNQTTGTMMITKMYPSHQFPLSCLMTPFGIVGSWGDTGWGGWVWLWKVPNSSEDS